MEQLQIPLVAGIRYFYMKRKINAAQILFAFAVCGAALGFVFAKEDSDDTEGKSVGEGLIMMLISVAFCSCAYCCSEYFLQNTLEEAKLTIIDKNIMFAIADIPIMIFVLFFDVFCERNLQGKPRSWNIFQGIDWYCFALIFNSIVFGIVKYPILDWANSLVLSIVLTLATALTWVVELALPKNKEEFSKQKLAIVCILIVVSIGFQWEGMNREKQKQKRKILVTEERIRVLQKVKKLL
jgi:O-antigen/teichoic acid export membrane protein